MAWLSEAVAWCHRCSTQYNSSLLFLVAAVYGMQGMRAYTDTAVLFLFADDFKLPKTSSQQYVKAFARIPWNFKWLIGLLADTFSIRQRHARPYLFIASVIGIVSVPLMGIKQITSTPVSCALALFGMQLYGAVSDVLTDALVVRSGRQNVEEGSASLQILSWICFGVGGMIMTLLGGLFTEHHQTRLYMLLLTIMPILFLIVVCRLHEPKSAFKTNGGLKSILQQLVRVALALLTPPYTVLKCSVWVFFSAASVIGMGDAVYLWKSEHIKISRQILAVGDALSYFGLILGTAMYYKYYRKTPFRTMFCYTQLLVAVFSLTDIILIRRINLTLGIPDVAFVFAFDVVNEIITRLRLMPFLILSAQLCPKHIEATFFALLMSLSNLSSDVAVLLGAVVQDWYNIGPLLVTSHLDRDGDGVGDPLAAGSGVGSSPRGGGEGSWENLEWGIVLRTIGTLSVLPIVLVVPRDLKTGGAIETVREEEAGGEGNGDGEEDVEGSVRSVGNGKLRRLVDFLNEFAESGDDEMMPGRPLGRRRRRGEGADYFELSEGASLAAAEESGIGEHRVDHHRESLLPDEEDSGDETPHSTAKLIPKEQ